MFDDLETDLNGNWILAGIEEEWISIDRSTDNGRSWEDFSQSNNYIWRSTGDPGYCGIGSGAIASDGAGVWLLAHGLIETSGREERDRCDIYRDGMLIAPDSSAIELLRSTDSGANWQVAGSVGPGGVGDYPGARGMELATDRHGTWLMVTLEKDLRSSASSDEGRTWSAPSVIAAESSEPFGSWQTVGLSLATDEQGRWVVAWRSKVLMADTLGSDVDVFSSYSTDAGRSWSPPAPANRYAGVDGVDDGRLSLATDGDGEWILVWSSHDPLGASIGRDADILASISTDGARSWSVPMALNAGASDDVAADLAPHLVAAGPDRWGLVWESEEEATPFTGYVNRSLLFARSPDACGDGIVDPRESCDDGNAVDGDGCDSDCSPSVCGNGIAAGGEECDDGNTDENDRCLGNCRLARCGDATVQWGIESCDDGNGSNFDECLNDCRSASCGDGFVQAGVEQCDDGNSNSNDSCLENCVVARCGDGVVWDGFEECDLGIFHDPLRCTDLCRIPVCGDGKVRPGVEQCDDGNDNDDDACSNDCRILRNCGDGILQAGLEQCDDGNPDGGDNCSEDCDFLPRCGDPDNDATPTASDAFTVLAAAIGQPLFCPARACDLNGDRRINAIDALAVLKLAVGEQVETHCPLADEFVIRIEAGRPFASLQVELRIPARLGAFPDDPGKEFCRPLLTDALSAASSTSPDKLSVGVISLAPIKPPLDLFRCAVVPFVQDLRNAISVRVVDARDPDLAVLDPPPVVSIQ